MIKPDINWKICQVCDPCDAKNECTVGAIRKIDLDEPVYIEYFLCNNCQKYQHMRIGRNPQQ